MRYFLLALLALPFLIGCNKEPGDGGRGEIQGTVYEQRYNGTAPSGAPYPLPDQKVYIIYGDGTYANDNTDTGPDGKYHFPWLRKGDYKIYAIGECNTCPSSSAAVQVSVSINGRKDVVTADSIVVRNY